MRAVEKSFGMIANILPSYIYVCIGRIARYFFVKYMSNSTTEYFTECALLYLFTPPPPWKVSIAENVMLITVVMKVFLFASGSGGGVSQM